MNVNNWRVKRDPSEIPAGEQTPNRSTQQRRSNGFDRSSPFEQRQNFGRSPQTPRDGFRKPFDDKKADDAIAEGRRVYVGNLAYEATIKDVESLLKDVASGIETVNMSVDPMTGRNPSYCFVDFKSQDLAQHFIQEYDGRDFLHRPLKVKPGVKSNLPSNRYDSRSRENSYRGDERQSPSGQPPFDRWRRLETPEQLGDAGKEGRRLYVGGLPRFDSQDDTNNKIGDLFADKGFKIEVVSKQISAHPSTKDFPGHHEYCFVDLATAADADKAIDALNGLEKWDSTLRVNKARGASGKVAERRRIYVGGLPEFDTPEALDAGIKELFEGFDVNVVSKLLAPREERLDEDGKPKEGNRHFCFVELADQEQADIAVEKLDWKEMWGGWAVRIKLANPTANKSQRPEPRGWGQSR